MIPKEAQLVHLYNVENILRPRGSMEKESLSQHIYEKLMWLFPHWSNPKYADSITDERELLHLIQKNLHEEVEIAVETFLENLRKDGVEGAYRYKM